MTVAVIATDLPPMTMGEFRSAITQAVNELIVRRPVRGPLVDLQRCRLVASVSQFHLEVDTDDPTGALADATPGNLRSTVTTNLNTLLNALPFAAGRLDTSRVSISYSTNRSLLIEVAPLVVVEALR